MAPTGHPRSCTMPPAMAIRHRYGRALIALALCGTVLVGCSTGDAPEARRGQEQDSKQESVISDMQATYTWELINGTPETTPTP